MIESICKEYIDTFFIHLKDETRVFKNEVIKIRSIDNFIYFSGITGHNQ